MASMTPVIAHGRQTGFTLVESLVALVVIAIGMLGMGALYVEGLRANRTSIYRTAAIDLAADMADRIRANPTAVAAYAGDGPGTDAHGCVNGAADCTPAELADDDTWWWHEDIRARLPGGAADIAVLPAGPTTAYTITISWIEAGLGEPLSYSLSMEQ
jgi:type IV pilus assembly protein PilV